jgi:pilus assembly protein CpaE
MFAALVIHAGPQASPLYSQSYLRALAHSTDCLSIVKDLDVFPSELELRRNLQLFNPSVVIVNLAFPGAFESIRTIRLVQKDAAILGYGASFDQAQRALDSGLDGVIAATDDSNAFRVALLQAIERQRGGLEANLFVFQPAKAGSGASTLALNLAYTISNELGKRVLLIDSDLRSGIQSVQLGINPKKSIEYILENIHEMTRVQLASYISKKDGVDFLLCSHNLQCKLPEWQDYNQLLLLLRGNYDAIIVDLPEVINPATIELVRRAQSLFVTLTPEIPSVALAKQRLVELKSINIGEDKIKLLVNRWQKTDPDLARLATLLNCPIGWAFPNDYQSVIAALRSSRRVDSDSRLGREVVGFALSLFPQMEAPEKSFTAKIMDILGITAKN